MKPHLTHHAQLRMDDMGLTLDDIIETLRTPEVVTPATRTRDRYGNRVRVEASETVRMFRRDGHAVIADCQPGQAPVVITVLVRTTEQYERATA